MADRLIQLEPERMAGDLVLSAGAVATTDGFDTAVAISLFTDARARADDRLPDGAGGDPRGWWADPQMGSLLWLLAREKQLPEVLRRAREYAEAALAWMTAKGYARKVAVATSVLRDGVLGLSVEIHRTDGSLWRRDYVYHWRAHAA